MDNAKLYILCQLRTRGWPLDLAKYIVTRASAAQADFDALVTAGYIEITGSEVRLTKAGRRLLKNSRKV